VIQEKVEVILMVTQLVEGFNRKADQFWPEVGDEVKVRGDVKVTHKGSYTEGILTIRQFVIMLPDGGKREVAQVQPEDWADLGTADGPRQLFEVLQHTNQMWRSSTGPLMVLCGDGSGRTGTLIAIYKLWIDLEDPDCGSLALLPTVLALRRQRAGLVQNFGQYMIIARCLRYMIGPEQKGASTRKSYQ